MRFFCQTCPYVQPVTKTVTKQLPLQKKKVDDVLGGEEAWANVDQTGACDGRCWERTEHETRSRTQDWYMRRQTAQRSNLLTHPPLQTPTAPPAAMTGHTSCRSRSALQTSQRPSSTSAQSAVRHGMTGDAPVRHQCLPAPVFTLLLAHGCAIDGCWGRMQRWVRCRTWSRWPLPTGTTCGTHGAHVATPTFRSISACILAV